MEYLNTEGSHTKVLIYKLRENPRSKKGRLHICTFTYLETIK